MGIVPLILFCEISLEKIQKLFLKKNMRKKMMIRIVNEKESKCFTETRDNRYLKTYKSVTEDQITGGNVPES